MLTYYDLNTTFDLAKLRGGADDVFWDACRIFGISDKPTGIKPVFDRSGTIEFPIQLTNVVPPVRDVPTRSNYHALLDERAENLVALSKRLNKRILVLFSGGIDSMTATVALLRVLGDQAEDRLVITKSPASIDENPTFEAKYGARLDREIISSNVSQAMAQPIFDSYVITSGECRGACLGGSRFFHFGSFGVDWTIDGDPDRSDLILPGGVEMPMTADLLYRPEIWEQVVVALYARNVTGGDFKRAEECFEFWRPSFAASPFPIDSFQAFNCWLTLNNKVQSILLRILATGRVDFDPMNLKTWAPFWFTPEFENYGFKVRLPAKTEPLRGKHSKPEEVEYIRAFDPDLATYGDTWSTGKRPSYQGTTNAVAIWTFRNGEPLLLPMEYRDHLATWYGRRIGSMYDHIFEGKVPRCFASS